MPVDFSAVTALANACVGYLKDIGGFALTLRDRQIFAAIQIDLSEKISQTQAQLIQINTTVIEEQAVKTALLNELRQVKDQLALRQRYDLAQLGTAGDFFAYRLRPLDELEHGRDEPMHFLCQPCFDAGKKSVLRITAHHAHCAVCGSRTPLVQQSGVAFSDPLA